MNVPRSGKFDEAFWGGKRRIAPILLVLVSLAALGLLAACGGRDTEDWSNPPWSPLKRGIEGDLLLVRTT